MKKINKTQIKTKGIDFKVYKASDSDYSTKINIKEIEDLMNIYYKLVINFKDKTIYIYDDYLE